MKLSSDRSFTLHSSEYNEHYHSVKDGAFRESLYKHIVPAFSLINQTSKPLIRVLDICFGLGYNALTTLYYLDQMNFTGRVEIYSVEKDENLLKSLDLMIYKEELVRFLPLISCVAKGKNYHHKNISVEVFRGDATSYLTNTDQQFDIIYQDPFSPTKNSELWSDQHFVNLYRLIGDDGVMTTYSQARGVRETMKKAGFCVCEYQAERSIRAGTIASKKPLKDENCLQV